MLSEVDAEDAGHLYAGAPARHTQNTCVQAAGTSPGGGGLRSMDSLPRCPGLGEGPPASQATEELSPSRGGVGGKCFLFHCHLCVCLCGVGSRL